MFWKFTYLNLIIYSENDDDKFLVNILDRKWLIITNTQFFCVQNTYFITEHSKMKFYMYTFTNDQHVIQTSELQNLLIQ